MPCCYLSFKRFYCQYWLFPLSDLHSQSCPRRRGPRQSLPSVGKSAVSSQRASSCPFVEDGKSSAKWYSITFESLFYPSLFTVSFITLSLFSLLSLLPLPLTQNSRMNKSLSSNAEPVESDVDAVTLTQTDGSPKSHPLPGWRANKNPSFTDELELQNILHKLSVHSLETQSTSAPGDTDSVSSHTSGWWCIC